MSTRRASHNVIRYLCGLRRGMKAQNLDPTLFFLLNAAAVEQHQHGHFTVTAVCNRIDLSYNTATHYMTKHDDLFMREAVANPRKNTARHHYMLTQLALETLNSVFNTAKRFAKHEDTTTPA